MPENLDMGRPDHVQLIFNRRVSRRTPTRYRTRVITDGVIPSLHVDYKHSRIKQFAEEGLMTSLRQRMLEDMQVRFLSPSTTGFRSSPREGVRRERCRNARRPRPSVTSV